MLDRLKDEKVKWEAKEIRKNMIDNYNKTFWTEISNRDMNKEAKKWHNSVKKLTRYTKPSTIIDLTQGPVAVRS